MKEEEPSLEDVNKQIVSKLEYYGFDNKEIAILIRTRDEDYIQANILRVEEYLDKGKKIKDIKGYLKAAFKSDYRRKESEYEKQKKLDAQAKGLALKKITTQQEKEQKFNLAFEEYKKELTKQKLAAMTKEEVESLKAEYLTSIKSSALKRAYEKGGFGSTFIQGQWYKFAAKKLLCERDLDFQVFQKETIET